MEGTCQAEEKAGTETLEVGVKWPFLGRGEGWRVAGERAEGRISLMCMRPE